MLYFSNYYISTNIISSPIHFIFSHSITISSSFANILINFFPPGTIIEVDPNGKWIKIQEDDYKRIDNNEMSDDQDYEYFRNPNGYIYTYKKNRLGQFTDNGRKDGRGLIIGHRERYYDFSF